MHETPQIAARQNVGQLAPLGQRLVRRRIVARTAPAAFPPLPARRFVKPTMIAAIQRATMAFAHRLTGIFHARTIPPLQTKEKPGPRSALLRIKRRGRQAKA